MRTTAPDCRYLRRDTSTLVSLHPKTCTCIESVEKKRRKEGMLFTSFFVCLKRLSPTGLNTPAFSGLDRNVGFLDSVCLHRHLYTNQNSTCKHHLTIRLVRQSATPDKANRILRLHKVNKIYTSRRTQTPTSSKTPKPLQDSTPGLLLLTLEVNETETLTRAAPILNQTLLNQTQSTQEQLRTPLLRSLRMVMSGRMMR